MWRGTGYLVTTDKKLQQTSNMGGKLRDDLVFISLMTQEMKLLNKNPKIWIPEAAGGGGATDG